MEITLEQATHANLHLYSDVYPYEIVRKISNKTLEVRKMNYKSTSRDFSNQQWKCYSDEKFPILRIRLHKDGTWRDTRNQNCRYLLNTKPDCYHCRSI